MTPFYKYQGCGNDFIMIDAREKKPVFSKEQIAQLCHRRFGIGADGLMYLTDSLTSDFSMEYYNSDGGKSTFCGNGGRCMVDFARFLKIIDTEALFTFDNVEYKATIEDGMVHLYMQNISDVISHKEDNTIHTGSPHYIHFERDIDTFELIPYARSIRYSSEFPEGINVNIVQELSEDSIKIRTYERGVEDETLSCGTGVTAAALVYALKKGKSEGTFQVAARGGDFKLKFKKNENHYEYVILSGRTQQVFKGDIDI